MSVLLVNHSELCTEAIGAGFRPNVTTPHLESKYIV